MIQPDGVPTVRGIRPRRDTVQLRPLIALSIRPTLTPIRQRSAVTSSARQQSSATYASGNPPPWRPTPTTSSTRSSSKLACPLPSSNSYPVHHPRSSGSVSIIGSLRDCISREAHRFLGGCGRGLPGIWMFMGDIPGSWARLVSSARRT
jgi:hypothetical protein